jgi:transcription-repair coupling factor (superfamily II helicase)
VGGDPLQFSKPFWVSPLAPSVSIDLPLPAFIPNDYVPDSSLRLRLYRRMAGLATMEEIEDMQRELMDRFGSLPGAVANLFYQLRLKVLALIANVQGISTEKGQIVIRVQPLKDTARKQLQKRLSGRARVSQRQIWLPLRERESIWRRELADVLETMAEVRER